MGHNTSRSYPLAPFERYMLMDDTHHYSMTCHIRLWFDGELLKEPFRAALNRTLEHHPLMRSILDRQPGAFGSEKLTFNEAPIDLDEILEWDDFTKPLSGLPLDQRDLRTRFHVRTESDRSLLIIRFHHAISDGQGIYGFTDDLLKSYDALVLGTPLPPIIRDLKLLEKRVTMGLNRWQWFKRWHLDMRRFLKFVLRFPTPMVATRQMPPLDPACLAANMRIVIPQEALGSFKATAKKRDVTFNEMLVTRLFQRLATWNISRSDATRPGAVYRMNIPISLRSKGDEAMPAANLVSMIFLDRKAHEIGDEVGLTQSIKKEMRHIKDNNMGLTLVRSVAAMTKIKFFHRFLRLPLCMASVGLTNLGRPLSDSSLRGADGIVRAGNVTVTGLDTLPPVRNLTRATLSVNRFNEDLSITLRWDSRAIGEVDARNFLNGYVASLIGTQNLPNLFEMVARTNAALVAEHCRLA